MPDFNYDTDSECLDVSVRSDGVDGSGNYKFICTLTHEGHQSYRQSFGLYFSTHVSVVEVPGDVDTETDGNHIIFSRKNQMSDNGLVEIWIKLSASEQPEVTGITDVTCLPDVTASAGSSQSGTAASAGSSQFGAASAADSPQSAASAGSAQQSANSGKSDSSAGIASSMSGSDPAASSAVSPQPAAASEPATSSCMQSQESDQTAASVTQSASNAAGHDIQNPASGQPGGTCMGECADGPVQRTIHSRRSVRSYRPDMLPKAVIDKIVESGTYAATGMNRQSPIIIAVTDKKTRDKLSAMNAEIMGTETDPFYGAPVVLIVLANKEMPTYVYDGSLVIGNMMLAAEELGIGSCWIHRAKEEFESDAGKEILHSLGISGDYEGIGHLILGYSDEEKKSAAPRKEHYVYYIS